MELSHSLHAPGTAVIKVAGKVMMGTVEDEIVELVEELLGEGKRIIVFDLGGITSLDSTGVGQFISSFNKVTTKGGEMRMAGATGHVFHTFHVSLLDQVFPFYPTVEAAMA
jgi:anti-sigma B factor antagonist